jgi:hypothetical protein
MKSANVILETSTVADLHHRAMELCDAALLAEASGEVDRSRELFREALAFESEAAGRLAPRVDHEPTRSVIHRSAVSMALRAGELDAAGRLIAVALSGDPPVEIAEELKDLLEQVRSEAGRPD